MYSRSIFFVFSLFVIAPIEIYADSAIQTDWSGGDGILGPVLEWGNEFYQSSFINWSYYPGSMQLLQSIMEHTVDGDFDGAYYVYSADIDGDGDMDILGAARIADDITWWENINGSGTFWGKHTVDGDFDGAGSVFSEDIDGDGDMDVLGAAEFDNEITWWENIDGSGTSWGKHTVDGSFDCARSVYSEDINGDGFMDILGAGGEADGKITWWENIDGSGTSWDDHTVDDFDWARCVYPEDINGNGFMDVLGGGGQGGVGDITWWENIDGSGISWTEHHVSILDGVTYSVCSADISGDYIMDILGAGGNDITWWNNGGGYGYIIDDENSWARSVYSVDIDGIGGMDVLGADRLADNITWWENILGSGWDWIKHIVDEDFDGAVCVYSEDIDGDGYMDILGAAYYGDDITWWDLTPTGWLESSILDTQGDTDWDYLEWFSQTPPETSLLFQVRASDDHTAMGDWSDDLLTSPCPLEGILNDGDRYVQYRSILSKSVHSDITPVLNEVRITWDPLGVGDDPQVTEYLLQRAKPNPACGVVDLGFIVPELSYVELLIFDLTGHIVAKPVQGEYSPGVHMAQIDELAPGIYFCRMISGDFAATQRFVVIK